MNNMPYSALGGVMTADLNERTKVNSYRFVSANIAQFIVGGLTLPLVAKFAEGSNRQHGWQMTMTIWAVTCFVLFLVTFFTTKERIKPVVETKSSPKQDFTDLLKNSPWIALVVYTAFHFARLTFRGGAHYNYYHHYADKAAMFDFVQKLGLTTGEVGKSGGLLDWIGYIVHGTRETAANSNVADVFNSIVNMVGTATTITVIMLSASFARRFGKKAVAVAGFALSTLNAAAFYLLRPTDATGMVALTILGSILYAPTIPLVWAIFADVADNSEWQTGRRFTGMVFATIGFSLKSGLALGSAAFLWAMSGFWGYETSAAGAANAIRGYHMSSSIGVGLLFIGGAIAIALCKLNKKLTLQMADELAERRQKYATAKT